MHNFYETIFSLENSLAGRNAEVFLGSLKKLVKMDGEFKVELSENAGLSIFVPKEPKGLDAKKNVVLLIHELSRTGAPVVAVDAAKTLAKNGFFVTVVSMLRGPLMRDLLDNGIVVILDKQLAIASDSVELLGRRHNYLYVDLLLEAFDTAFVVTAVYRNLIRRYADWKKPIFWWLHEGSAAYVFLGTQMPQKVGKNIMVYVGGQYALDQLKHYCLPYTAEILNYGVSDNLFEEEQTKDTSIVRFILPGSIGIRKGQELLVEAIKRLPKKYLEKSEFILIGDLVSEADLDGKKVREKIISATKKFPNVQYLKSVSREALFDIYKKIDVLVLPSLDDPMPVVATEALMLKKVVLCANTVGTSYYLKDGTNGFVFESGNVDELSEKIKAIVDKRDSLAKIGQNGRKVYEENFEMKMFEKNLLTAIRRAK